MPESRVGLSPYTGEQIYFHGERQQKSRRQAVHNVPPYGGQKDYRPEQGSCHRVGFSNEQTVTLIQWKTLEHRGEFYPEEHNRHFATQGSVAGRKKS